MNQKQTNKALGKILRLSCESQITGWYWDAKSETRKKVYSNTEKDVPQFRVVPKMEMTQHQYSVLNI